MTAIVAAGVAAATTALLVPLAIALAHRTGFLDHPREYRAHGRATPFLGGAAVLAGAAAGTLAAGRIGEMRVIFACAAVLLVVGTADDRFAVPPKWRLIVEIGAAAWLYAAGFGWSTRLDHPAGLLLTVVWVAGLVNAFNLMDNMDGACATVASVCGCGIGALAVIRGQTAVAAVAFALVGACASFLRFNLARPARIFLGDGGSMPVGFLVAALAMAACRHSSTGSAGILVAAMLCGMPILDVALVSVSRTRRGVSLLTGGRDHLTHRVALWRRHPHGVAVVLATGQALLCGVAILGYVSGLGAVAAIAAGCAITGLIVIAVLDRPARRPAGIAYGPGGEEPVTGHVIGREA